MKSIQVKVDNILTSYFSSFPNVNMHLLPNNSI